MKHYEVKWTHGVGNLVRAYELSLGAYVDKAINLHHSSNDNTFFKFERKGKNVIVQNGDFSTLGSDIDFQFPYNTEMWIIIEDYGKHFEVTALLPDEY